MQDYDEQKIFQQVEEFLYKLGVEFIKPGHIGRISGNKVEVIYFKPDAFDPDCVIDPPDNRVWFDILTNEITWIHQM